jgi:hypothetical protein
MGPIEEKEFDPSEYAAEYVTVGKEEEIQSILAKVEDAWTRTPNAVLVIPRGAQAFHSTQDFLALGKLQGAREVRVSIASLDPTIGGLARVLGFHIVEPPADHPALVDDPAVGEPEPDGRDIEKPTAPLPLPISNGSSEWVVVTSAPPALPAYPASLTTSTWLNHPTDGALFDTGGLSKSDMPSEPLARPGVPAPRTRPRQTGYLAPSTVTSSRLAAAADEGTGSLPMSTTPSGRIKARRVVPAKGAYRGSRRGRAKPIKWGRIVAVLVTLLALSLSAAGVYAYTYLPEGQVDVVPLNQSITALPIEIPVLTASSSGDGGKVGVASPPQQAPAPQPVSAHSVAAQPLKTQIVEEGTRPASGTRKVLRGRGQGTMTFTNQTSNPVFVPLGLQFKAPNGVIVQTTKSGTVPATNYISQQFGTLKLPIAATVEGPDGNIGEGQLCCIYAGTLSYINSAMQGGTSETIKVVTQEDIDGLAGELRARVESKVSNAIADLVTPGQQLITQTITLGVGFEADHKAGDDGEAVKVKMTGEARAYMYKEADLQNAVNQAIQEWVENKFAITVGPSLDWGSVQYAPPAVQSVQKGQVVYATSANARVLFSLTPELERQIRDLIKGQKVERATSLITETYGTYINPLNIQASVLWFGLDKLPDDPARIDVEARSAPSITAPGSAPPAQGTPDPRSSQP